jgi:hypothetical protein
MIISFRTLIMIICHNGLRQLKVVEMVGNDACRANGRREADVSFAAGIYSYLHGTGCAYTIA